MKYYFSPAAIAYGACFATALMFSPQVFAIQTFIVNTTLDQPDTDPNDHVCQTSVGTCSLRAAIMQANYVTSTDVTIVVPAGVYTLTTPSVFHGGDDLSELTLATPASGSPAITIVGAGTATTIIDGNGDNRVFSVGFARAATIREVTIRNGSWTWGAGIKNAGTLTLDHVLVSGNANALVGGGIDNSGNLTVRFSSIVGNTASSGGGVYNRSGGSLTAIASTVASNSADNGGGLFNADGGTMIIVNSTIAGNHAITSGGGVASDGSGSSGTFYNATIVYNDADHDNNGTGNGGGIFFVGSGSTLNFSNSLLAGNYVGNTQPVYSDCDGIGTLVMNGYGFSLIGSSPGTSGACTVYGDFGTHDFLNSTDYLGTLQSNGGPTQTVALLSGSNAIDTAGAIQRCRDQNSQPIQTDQRGFPRNVGPCDVGAFEYGAIDDVIFRDGFE